MADPLTGDAVSVRTLDTLTRFCASARTVGVVLPDGWFGRPFDNRMTLTGSEIRDKTVVLQFDHVGSLMFTGQASATTEAGAVCLSGFDDLQFEWRGADDDQLLSGQWSSGVVWFVDDFLTDLPVPEVSTARMVRS